MLTALFSCLIISATAHASYAQETPPADFTDIKRFLDEGGKARIYEHVRYLSSIPSRVSGYPGFFQAVDYVAHYLEDLGIQPYGADTGYFDYYNITVPLDEGASVILPDGHVMKAYPLWPNDVNPTPYTSPPEGDELVNVARGRLEDYQGLDVEGKFVLMDFTSQWMFRFAAMLGAKGIIYWSGSEITRMEASTKLYNIPLNFPRIFVSREDGLKLTELMKTGILHIRVESRMAWRNVQVPNVIGLIEGNDPELKDEYILLAGYVDSWSIVPGLAPGATDALGISALLELARYLKETGNRRSVVIAALSGQHESLWGAREWVDRHFQEIGHKYKMFISFDFSYGSAQVGLYAIGSMYSYMIVDSLNVRYARTAAKLFREYLGRKSFPGPMKDAFGLDFAENAVEGFTNTHPEGVATLQPFFFEPRKLACEPFNSATYGGGMGFITVNDAKTYARTQADTLDRVVFDNVWPQVEFAYSAVKGFAIVEDILPIAADPPHRFLTDSGYANLNLTAVLYNLSTAFFDPVKAKERPEIWKDLIIHFTAFPGPDVIVKPDEVGRVTVKGLKPYTVGAVSAYVINSSNGRIEWATDVSGAFGVPGGSGVYVNSESTDKMISIFRSSSVILYNLLNPQDLTRTLTAVAYNHVSHAPMLHYSTAVSQFADYIFFIEPYTPTEILVQAGGETGVVGGTIAPGAVWTALINLTREEITMGKEALGYVLAPGDTYAVVMSPYEYFNQLYYINDERIKVSLEFSATNPATLIFHEMATDKKKIIDENLQKYQWGLAYGNSYAAWGFERKSYSENMNLIQQIISTIAFFSILIVPFAFFMERLLFSYMGQRRIIVMLVILSLSLMALALFHPGFTIAHNSLMVLIALAMVVVMLPILFFIAQEARGSARIMRQIAYRHHAVEVTRGSVFSAALGVGVGNMRKHKLRSAMTLTSVTLVMFGLITFTSIALVTVPRFEAQKDVPLVYEGIMLRRVPWPYPATLPHELYLGLKEELGADAIVAPRGWMYPPSAVGTRGRYTWTPEEKAQLAALLLVGSDEPKIAESWNNSLLEGRWFGPNDVFSILISRTIAENLTEELGTNIGVGSVLPIWGVNLTVVGIFDGDRVFNGGDWELSNGIMDLDGEPITPIDLSQVIEGATIVPHVRGFEIAIVPYDLAWLLVGPSFGPQSISIVLTGNRSIQEIAMEMAYRFSIDVISSQFTSRKEGIGDLLRVSTRTWVTWQGAEALIIPILIGVLTILNMMIANVYQRTNEITVYNAVGVSPMHVAGMFLSETSVFAVIGSTLGYMLGIASTRLLIILKQYPEAFFPNYSSFFVLTVIAVALLAILGSSVYPAMKASRLVTPSLVRRWRAGKPQGDVWGIPLPFVAEETEMSGLLAFIREYCEHESGESQRLFYAVQVRTEELTIAGHSVKRLVGLIRLAPFDTPLSHQVILEASTIEAGKYTVNLICERREGARSSWIRTGRVFIDRVRKQFLVWRVLPDAQKADYYELWGKHLAEEFRYRG